MATELMRLLDYWMGLPICFLLAGFNRIVTALPFKQKEKSPPDILLIKLSEMGAVILSYSLIKRIKQEYPESRIFFLTFRKNLPLVKILNIIKPEDILTIREDSPFIFMLDTFRVILRMRKEGIDIAFDLELFSRFTAILAYLSKAKKRIGYYRYYFEGLYRGGLLTHNVQYNPLIHTSKSILSLAQVMKSEEKDTPELQSAIEDNEIISPEFISTTEEIEKMRGRLGGLGIGAGNKLFLINPGEGIIPQREWPFENFVNLTKRLLADKENNVIIIGAAGKPGKAALLFETINDERCVDFSNKTSLVELLNLFAISKALIANDCGLAHIASLTPIKKFIIFGPESPLLYSPLGENNWIIYSSLACSPCLSAFNHRKSACKDSRCLKVIKADEVYELIKANT